MSEPTNKISVPKTFAEAVQHHRAGEFAQAENCYLQVLKADPRHVDALHLLGVLEHQQGKNDQAIANIRAALELKEDLAEAHYNLGVVYKDEDRLDEAVASFQQATRYKPEFFACHLLLGGICRELGRLDESIAAYRAASELRPEAAQVRSKLILTLNYHPACNSSMILEECRRWNQQYAEPLRQSIQPHTNDRHPERKLRIGYVSSDFRAHAGSLFLLPLLAHHDRQQCEVFCYAGVGRPDEITERIRRHADEWRSTLGVDDEKVAGMVRADGIDILVDLNMHMSESRLLIFARKPAPVQVAWLAYPGTTGLAAMDYRLTDPYLDPPGDRDGFYSEQSMRLPDTFWCYDPMTDQPEVNALPALTNGFITFGSLNSFCKVNDDVLSLWAKVLEAVPGSRLLMLAPHGRAREHVLARLGEGGVAAARIDFVDRQSRPEYLKLYYKIDLGLEPFPANGHTTSFDGFWMGVPTVTLVGETVVGRAGWSQLNNLRLVDLAAHAPAEYVNLVSRLAGDLPRLQQLRASLRERMRRSPLMDGELFARNVEKAYRQMWRCWCAT